MILWFFFLFLNAFLWYFLTPGSEITDFFHSMKILLIDNYDSFTFNLVQAMGQMGAEIRVWRNDTAGIDKVSALAPDRIIISPGPKKPEDAGVSKLIIEAFGPRIPILGVCLGMQCINEVYGGETQKARVCVHGKTSPIFHRGQGLYRGVSSPFSGARYHSLIVGNVPEVLAVDAWTAENIPMGLRHRDFPVTGVQFHPESFLTESGERILKHFMAGEF